MQHSINNQQTASLALAHSIGIPGVVSSHLTLLHNVRVRYGSTVALKHQMSPLRHATLPLKHNVMNTCGYEIWHRAADGGVADWIYDGFLAADTDPLEFLMPALPDGEYEIQFRLKGYAWDAHRLFRLSRLRINGGTPLPVEQVLPSIKGLRVFKQSLDYHYLQWTWEAQLGTVNPTSFGLWVSGSTPISYAGDPDQTVNASGPGVYRDRVFDQTGLDFYVGVRAKRGALLGPALEITVPGSLGTPANVPWSEAFHAPLPEGIDKELGEEDK